MTDEFYIKVSNCLCEYKSCNFGIIKCMNSEHPDYYHLKICECNFEKCPLSSKCKQ